MVEFKFVIMNLIGFEMFKCEDKSLFQKLSAEMDIFTYVPISAVIYIHTGKSLKAKIVNIGLYSFFII
jgi:hypothetical protein